ncbi:MAG: hypothetical protein GX326_03610 [Clostridiaceae bacterium]|nr:hypothetical protein [Clostridiaceae bacterium]
MKKISTFLLVYLALTILLVACSKGEVDNTNNKTSTHDTEINQNNVATSSKNDIKDDQSLVETEPNAIGSESDQEVLACKLIERVEEADSNIFLLAGEGEFDLFHANFNNAEIIIDNEESNVEDLKNGMQLDVYYSGIVQESYPAIPVDIRKVVATSPQKGDYSDLVTLYTQVLIDLLEDDRALNEDINFIGLELGNAPGNLNKSEINAIAYLLQNEQNNKAIEPIPQVIIGSYQEFVDQGYIDEEKLVWEDGVLLTIELPNPTDRGCLISNQDFLFDATKWRSGIGAIFWLDCSVTWDDAGYWESYEIGAFAIS